MGGKPLGWDALALPRIGGLRLQPDELAGYAFGIADVIVQLVIERTGRGWKANLRCRARTRGRGRLHRARPAFPEIVTYGKDEREALAMAEDAIQLVIADCVARGEPIPKGEPPRIREVTVTLAA
jgi:predicted RNase H-like HicB family nuclease